MVRSILIVDDETEIAKVARLTLEGAGYAIRTASSGPEALASIADARPDLVLLDVNMPGMDGWEVLRLIGASDRQAGRDRRLPVVMFSIKLHIHDKVHALQEGAYDYITKPFSHDELIERVGRISQTLEVPH